MKTRIAVTVLAGLVLTMGMGCGAPEKRIIPPAGETGSPATTPMSMPKPDVPEQKLGDLTSSPETPSVSPRRLRLPEEPLKTVKAAVLAVDLTKRLVTLRDAKGNVFDLKVGTEVTNLPLVRVGDEVTAKYFEWSALQLKKKGERKARVVRNAPRRFEPGQEPHGVVREVLTAAAKVERIDHARTHVTIKHPDGRSTTIFIKRPSRLDDIEQGDSVVITYIEALAVSLEKAK